MAEQTTPPPAWTLIALGLLTAAAGVYFGLVGFDIAPSLGRINGPLWIALFVGLVFFAGGIAVIVSGATGAYDRAGELPADAPVWVATVYWLASVAVAAGLAAIGSWVAFGGGTRHFSISGFFSGSLGEGIGRTVFGIGAIITWLIVLVFARAGAKRIFGKKN
ncbi:MAG: hypothetical protein HY244_00120 [Rhizobiales bacterium]|nr:hypothetical protein [Hyphomicrobiales bacterium]